MRQANEGGTVSVVTCTFWAHNNVQSQDRYCKKSTKKGKRNYHLREVSKGSSPSKKMTFKRVRIPQMSKGKGNLRQGQTAKEKQVTKGAPPLILGSISKGNKELNLLVPNRKLEMPSCKVAQACRHILKDS